MEIIVAKTAGFCFGVNKAINLIMGLLDNTKEPIYTIGPIIHNEQVVNGLKDKGAKPVKDVNEIETSGYVLIRAHGVVPEVYEEIDKKPLKVIDATCPFVKKIQKLAAEKLNEGFKIIIVGDEDHPEVIGIKGWCNNLAEIVNSPEDVNNLKTLLPDDNICVVAQTTLTNEKWKQIVDILKNKFENLVEFDTICSATNNRQNEASSIAEKVDMMLVIGSKNSSNTQKLYEISKAKCKETFMVQTSGDLPPVDINKIKKVGITAGASTPDFIIKGVIEKMEELNKENNEMSNEMEFQEAFEKSLVTLTSGEVVKGKIIGYTETEVFVDLGYKSDGIIQLSEFADDPDFDPKSLVEGEELEVYVVRVNDKDGIVQLSKRKADAEKGMDLIGEAYENKSIIKARVTETTKGGVLANVSGTRIFIPGSQLSNRFIKDMSEFLKKTLDVKIIEFDKYKRRIIGSHKIVLVEERELLSTKIWEEIEIGKAYTGTVKSLADFGAFVDIGGVDGLVHISELSWAKIKHPSDVLKVGDKAEVFILEFDKEKNKISLGYRKAEDNPWYNIEEKYKAEDIVKGKVVRLVPFGAFVEIEKGVDGLVHISQISNRRIAKPSDVLEVGQEIEAKILELDTENNKMSLSIKEINPIDAPISEEESAIAANNNKSAEAVPTVHVEEMSITLGDMFEEAKADAEAEAEVVAEEKVEPKAEEVDTKAEAKVEEVVAEVEAETEAETKPEVETETEAETKPEAVEAEAKVEEDTEVKEAETKPDAEAETVCEIEA